MQELGASINQNVARAAFFFFLKKNQPEQLTILMQSNTKRVTSQTPCLKNPLLNLKTVSGVLFWKRESNKAKASYLHCISPCKQT